MSIMSHEIRLASRPNGIPTANNLGLAQTEIRPLKADEQGNGGGRN